ncbi:Proactivator polypeptide-like 1 [Myotis davidii]|uniref:Proactivator polypeptide-like 1 n=1 Tax=Myotis davidii TaxID=225400 RepID=L5M3J8_MYODS|nr:Proactivator polypeptide-like 1 [Myotis davidii]
MAHGPLSFHLPPIPEDPVCQDCVRLVTRLQDEVGSNVSALADVVTREQCKSLGPDLALICRDYILRFLGPGEHMLKLVLPEETCEKGGFCEEGQVPAELMVPPLEPLPAGKRTELQMQAGLTCEVCLQVIQEMDQWLDSNSTEVLISQALERVCSVMPASIVQQCVTMVDAYSPSLVQFVTRVPCKSTKRGILQAFKGGCHILPLPYMIQCNRFVDEYEPVLFATLSEMMDPTALCAKVGACHAPRAPLLGTDQCVLGPSFWCASQEAAQMCNALEHCQRFIWKVMPFNTGEPECPPRGPSSP